MKNINKLIASLSMAAACLAGISPSAQAAVAGHVQFISGKVEITDTAGRIRTAQKGDAISEGDTLTSAPSSSAQIKMQDGGFVAVRADTRLKFDEFVFAGKEDGSEKSFFSLFKGGFRAVTGLIGRINKQNYRITTPAATIGIRGTDHESFVISPDSPLAQVAPAGAYNKVNVGETYMATEKGTIFVQPNQMGFAGGMNQMPQLQPLNTNIFTVAEAPVPEARIEKKEEKKEEAQAETTAENGAAAGTAQGAESVTQEETAPVRETAVVDAAPPAAGTVPASTAPAIGAISTDTAVFVPVVEPVPVILPVDGQIINLTTQTIATAGGTPVAITGSNPLYAAQNGYGYEVLGVDALGTWFNPYATILPGTSYMVDGANNLLEILGGEVKFTGGAALDTFKAADSSVYMGRWQGGSVTYTDPITLAPVNLTMGANSSQWVFAANPPAGYVQTLGGTTTYSLTAATHPTDKFGNVGTLTSATLSADFTNQIVNIALALSFSTGDPVNISTHNKAFTVTTPTGIQIFGQEIWGAGTVACTGANCDVGGYYASIWARFAANTADKVAIPYDIWSNTVAADAVQGVAMVTAATAPVVSPVAPAGTVAPYAQTDVAAAFVTASTAYSQPFLQINSGIFRQADINNTLPTPSFTDRNAGKDPASYITYTLSGITTEVQAATTLANGISFGRYDSTQSTMQVVGTTDFGPAGTYVSPGPVYSHWITGPAVDPVYLPEVLLATNAVYTFAGGTTPTVSSLGTPPVVTLSSASLSVNFTQQLVAFNLTLSNSWTASTAGTPLEFTYPNNAKTGFRASTQAFTGWGSLTASNGAGAITGDVTGQLTGSGLDGALLSYHLKDVSTEITGVAAFTGAAQTAPSYRLAGLSAADPNPPANAFPNGQYPVGGVVPIPVTLGGYNNATTVTMDGAGNLTAFRSDGAYVNGVYNVSKGAAVATSLGTDPVSGISWGRWDGASFVSTNVATGAPGIANTGSAHWIASPVLTGPVTLPVTGVFNYVLAGGTVPTDSLGGVGTLNGATLSANFTAQTVSIGLNVTTPNAGNLIASATNLPIEQKSFFNAATAGAVQGGGAPGSLTVTCGAGCVGTPQGQLGGVFAGSGGLGAAVLYGFAAGTSNTVIVNGVAAFHR